MSTVLIIIVSIVALVVGLFAMMLVGNLLIIRRTNKMKGEPLPDLPGELGKNVKSAKRAVLYFFSPNCAACRMLTPRFREMKEKGKSVFMVDISQQIEIARALRIMATPTTLEVEKGQVVGVHVGPVRPEDMARIEAA